MLSSLLRLGKPNRTSDCFALVFLLMISGCDVQNGIVAGELLREQKFSTLKDRELYLEAFENSPTVGGEESGDFRQFALSNDAFPVSEVVEVKQIDESHVFLKAHRGDSHVSGWILEFEKEGDVWMFKRYRNLWME